MISPRATDVIIVASTVPSRLARPFESFCHDAHSRVLAHGLTSASAIAFFDSLPSAEDMMPLLAMPSVEEILQTRKAALEAKHQQGYSHHLIERDWGIDS